MTSEDLGKLYKKFCGDQSDIPIATNEEVVKMDKLLGDITGWTESEVEELRGYLDPHFEEGMDQDDIDFELEQYKCDADVLRKNVKRRLSKEKRANKILTKIETKIEN